MALRINADNFEEKVLKADKPVLVDFYSDTCILSRSSNLLANPSRLPSGSDSVRPDYSGDKSVSESHRNLQNAYTFFVSVFMTL